MSNPRDKVVRAEVVNVRPVDTHDDDARGDAERAVDGAAAKAHRVARKGARVFDVVRDFLSDVLPPDDGKRGPLDR